MKKLSLTLLITALTLAFCGRSAAEELEVVESDEGWRRSESHTESSRNEHALLLEDEAIVEHSAAEDEAEDEEAEYELDLATSPESELTGSFGMAQR